MPLVSRIYKGQGAKKLKRIGWQADAASSEMPEVVAVKAKSEQAPKPASNTDAKKVTRETLLKKQSLKGKLVWQIVQETLIQDAIQLALAKRNVRNMAVDQLRSRVTLFCESPEAFTPNLKKLAEILQARGFGQWTIEKRQIKASTQARSMHENTTSPFTLWELCRHKVLGKSPEWLRATAPDHVNFDMKNRVITFRAFVANEICRIECKKLLVEMKRRGLLNWKIRIVLPPQQPEAELRTISNKK